MARQWSPAAEIRRGFTVDVYVRRDDRLAALRADVIAGLTATPKALPPKWFYDERGSRLFEAITRLPEYYLTRAERSILEAHAAEIAELTNAATLVEIGSGTSEKTRLLLDALVQRSLRRFVALDVSEATLLESGPRIAAEYPGIEVHAVVGDFERDLDRLPTGERTLVAFLGSSIGNLLPGPRASFLAELRAEMSDGDAFLLGVDLVKDVARLEAAYNDAEGVTAEFNRNVLAVLNRELGADFALERFDHVARFDREREWIEMLLRSRVAQRVTVAALGLEIGFARGEEMRTEISAKFRRERLEEELAGAGLALRRWWTDARSDFALSLSVPA